MPLRWFVAALLAALLLAPLAWTAASRDAEASVAARVPPRPIVLLVHGRGHGGLDTAMLRQSWERTLTTAATRLTGHAPFTSGDVSLVWYAGALNADSGTTCMGERAARKSAPDDPFTALLGFSSFIVSALTAEMGGEAGRELRNVAGELRYFADPERRCAAEEQVGRALRSARREGRPVILVAHSMGALVSWNYLQGLGADTTPPLVRRLVTVGSPIGSREIRRLLVHDATDGLALPPSVEGWVNVVDARDPFAVPLGAHVPGLSDVATRDTSSDDPHGIERYLSDPATVTAVLDGWCGAFDPASRPAGCVIPATR